MAEYLVYIAGAGQIVLLTAWRWAYVAHLRAQQTLARYRTELNHLKNE